MVLIVTLAGIAPLYGSDWVFTGTIPCGHREKVSAVIHRGNTIISAGEDGFLGIWEPAAGHAAERFQISPHSIIAMAERPGTDELCVLESDNFGLYRVAVWNFRERRNIFTLQFRDPISYISYSMGGNFIIAARTDRAGLVLINSVSGELLRPPPLTGTVGLAVTGRSERNMLVYLNSGVLSYWDLESGNETSRFSVPANLYSPALFSNSRYLAGVNAQGLTVIHAASGEIIERDNSIPNGSLLCPAGDDFICLVQNRNGTAELYRYTIRNGQLVKSSKGIPAMNNGKRFTAIAAAVTSAAPYGKRIAIGTSDGLVLLADMNDEGPRTLAVRDQIRIIEAELSGTIIAFIAEDGTIGFIPLNYTRLSAGTSIHREPNGEGYNRISAFAGENGGGQFIFWQDRNAGTQPVIRTSDTGSQRPVSANSRLRSPLRSVSSFGGKVLMLDSTGNLSVVSPSDTGRSNPFTFFSVGLMDAAFIDRDRIILGRSAVSGNTPLLMINVNTGETVPLPYHSQAVVTVHRGVSGNIYAVAISPRDSITTFGDNAPFADEARTSIFQLNLTNSANSVRLVDFQEEDTQFSLVESSGNIAATIGGESAAIYSSSGIQKLERTAGLPLRLIDGGLSLVCLDRDGNICWYDSRTGKLLAVFRLHPDEWALQTERGTVSGRLAEAIRVVD